VVAYEFRNMTQQDKNFLCEKFHLKEGDSINTEREQQLSTSMRMDLFYQTAECRSLPENDGVRVILSAGNRKTSQVSVGFRFDNEEYAAVQLGAEFPIATAFPVNFDLTTRLGKRIMASGSFTLHLHNFTRPKIAYTYRRNDLDIFLEGDRDYSILYHHHQADLLPINISIRNFNLAIGPRWDYFHYKDKLVASHSKDVSLKNDHYISYRATLKYSSEDNWLFPTKGSRFNAAYAYITDNFTKLDGETGLSDLSASWRTSFSLNSRFTLQPMAYGRILYGNSIPLVFSNAIGQVMVLECTRLWLRRRSRGRLDILESPHIL